MRLALHEPTKTPPFDAKHAAYVVGVLGLLIDIVGPTSFLATLLRQTRTEVLSLLAQDGGDSDQRVA